MEGIEIQDFCLTKGSFHLKNINFSVHSHEIFVLLGKTGSGKTMLLESIAGFYTGGRGNIRIGGTSVLNIPIEKRKIGFVYQDYGLFPHMNVYENISYGLRMKRMDAKLIHQKVTEMAEQFSISQLLKQYPSTLSGGERQRTALARALVLDPDVLLLDEPFSALDPMTKAFIYKKLLHMQKEYGCTTVMVTHSFEEAQMFGNRIGILSHGELKAVRNKENLFMQYEDEDINQFLGIERKLQNDKRRTVSYAENQFSTYHRAKRFAF